MHHKDIKAQIRKQLKTQFPNWHRLTRKEKKEIARQVLEQVIENYDSSKEIATPVPDLIGLSDQQPTEGIMTVDQMAEFVAGHQSNPLLRLYGKHSPHPAIKDIELQYIDQPFQGSTL
ncbi:hypothetical protein DSCO28_70160 [Desulfosarcina ovata subsp. sediminis]|uniref:Uncharacterized protein n=1 Tax=Desulfosarcina ovata subsp. sediminis TaxID=885957 RepID=A0A5K8A2F4_9BACT|nr:hypothetical protein [Desulfosarcina ovata]BBO86450.1 hypothetical protein DSCO28_70160 [Desulfosarcina ovata subsp. sediminis]